MRLLKLLFITCASVNALIFAPFATANVSNQSISDDWQYHINESEVVTLHVDLPLSLQNQQSTRKENSPNAPTEKSTNNLAKAFELSLIKFDAKTPLVKGFAILVNDYAQPRKINNSLMFLARHLPDYGYNTIIVGHDQRLINYFADSSHLNTGENSAQTAQKKREEASKDDEKIAESPSPQIASQTGLKSNMHQAPDFEFSEQEYNQALALILTKIEQQYLNGPGYKIYISNGMSAFSLIKILSEDSKLNANALAFSNPFWPEHNKNKNISLRIAKLKIPVLDLITSQSNRWSDFTSEHRHIAAKRAFLPFYRQRTLANGAGHRPQMEYEKRELVSWLKYLGW